MQPRLTDPPPRLKPVKTRHIIIAIIFFSALASGVYYVFWGHSPLATTQCRDGTTSYSLHRQGTCSWHGGVAMWFR
jgi:hypothetical protein